MSTQPPTELPNETKKKSCFERTIIILIRLVFAVVIGIAIGVGIYFGVKLLYDEYQSLANDYASRIAVLETNQTQSDELIADRMSSFQTRLETLEIQGDTHKDAIADLESRLESQDEFRSNQSTAVADQQQTILNMQDTILAMQTELNNVQSELETIQNTLLVFQEDITALETNTQALTELVEEYNSSNQTAIEGMNEKVSDIDSRMISLEHKMTFLVAMELLTRARLNLVQGNFTLAQSDIEAARDLMIALQEKLTPSQSDYIDGIIAAIDDLLKYIPGAPLNAADKLESVWQLLAVGLPDLIDSIDDTSIESTLELTPTMTTTPSP